MLEHHLLVSSQQHEKAMKQLCSHEDLLKQILYHCSSLDMEIGSVTAGESLEFPALGTDDLARSHLRSPPVGSPDGSHSPAPSIFNSYTQHDLDLKLDAQKVHSRMSICHTERDIPRPPRIQQIVSHPGFDIFFGFVVVTNSIFIGIEVQRSVGEPSPPVSIQATVLGSLKADLMLVA